MGRPEGKVAFMTGAGSGIAPCRCSPFSARGGMGRHRRARTRAGAASEQWVRESGGEATFIETDVTEEDSVRSPIRQTVERYGKLDVLYNCAGGSVEEDTRVTDVEM